MADKPNIRALYIEDSSIDQRVFLRFIEKHNLPYDCVVTSSITEAKRLLGEQAFDVVISDYFLPDGTALDIFADCRGAPILVVTSGADEEAAANVIKAGASDYLLKDNGLHFLKALPLSIENAIARKRSDYLTRMLSNAIMSIQDSVYIEDADGKIVFVNKAFCDTYGYAVDEVLGSSGDRFSGEQREQAEAGPGAPFWNYHERKDGEKFPIFMSSSVVTDDRQAQIAKAFVVRDITELRRDEEERRRLEEQLRQSQKMEAMGKLAGGVAHDFNNILGSIIGYTEMSMDDAPTGSQLGGNLDQVLKAAHRARDLVETILTFSRHNPTAYSVVKLESIIEEATRLLSASLAANVQMSVHINTRSSFVMAQPTQMHQVVMNLCTNAGHAMKINGGALRLELNELVLLEERVVNGKRLTAGRYLKMSVSDTGPGIPPEIKARLFEPFFTTKPQGEGTGLGLAIVEGAVREHGGALEIWSEVGSGTRFDIYLPSLGEDTVYEEKQQEERICGSGHVLFVDDERQLLEFAEQALKRLGYEVTTCSNGVDALELFSQNPSGFDLVITDERMPIMTGGELGRRLLELRPELPVILCTGFSDQLTAEQAARIGMRAFVKKPYSLVELSRHIANALVPAVARE